MHTITPPTEHAGATELTPEAVLWQCHRWGGQKHPDMAILHSSGRRSAGSQGVRSRPSCGRVLGTDAGSDCRGALRDLEDGPGRQVTAFAGGPACETPSVAFDFSAFPVLITDRIILRELRKEDAADLLVFRGDAEEQRFNSEPLQTP